MEELTKLVKRPFRMLNELLDKWLDSRPLYKLLKAMVKQIQANAEQIGANREEIDKLKIKTNPTL